jgi:hypothetical protein
MKHRLQIPTAVTHLLCDSLTTPVDAIVCRVIAVGLCDQDAELCTVSKGFGFDVLYDSEELGEVDWVAPHSMDENEKMNGGHDEGGKDKNKNKNKKNQERGWGDGSCQKQCSWAISTPVLPPKLPRSAMCQYPQPPLTQQK